MDTCEIIRISEFSELFFRAKNNLKNIFQFFKALKIA